MSPQADAEPVHHAAPGTPPELGDRYGARKVRRRGLLIGVSVLLATISLAWLIWAMWVHTNPAVSSEVGNHRIVSTHAVEAVVDISLEDDAVDPNCRIRALAEDRTIVGELSFRPSDGRNKVQIRTERRATSVELLGCTAEGQSRPQ